jgi:hypothetical protein
MPPTQSAQSGSMKRTSIGMARIGSYGAVRGQVQLAGLSKGSANRGSNMASEDAHRGCI